MATEAAATPRPARIWVSSPPKECPIRAGFFLSLPDHVAEVISNLPDTFVGEDLRVLVGVLDGVGIIGPARGEGGVARLLEHRPPAIPAGRQQPQPVDEHDRSELRSIGFLDLLCFIIGDVRHDLSCPLGSKAVGSASPGSAALG
jgi:hypothetical protein